DSGELEVDGVGAEVVEQSDAVAEEDRDEVDLDRVEEARSQALLGQGRTDEADVLVSGYFFGLVDGALHAVGDEGVGALPLRDLFGWVVRDDEQGEPRDGSVAAPTVGDVIGAPAGDRGPATLEGLFEDIGAG